MKTKITKETKEEQQSHRKKVREIVLSSRFAKHIDEQYINDQLLGDIANALDHLNLEESIVDALSGSENLSEQEIFFHVAGMLGRQAHDLREWGKTLKSLSRMKMQAVREVEADRPKN